MNFSKSFGPYQILKQIAVGGMAEIVLAKTVGFGGFEKLLVLKMIHPKYSLDKHFIQMMIEEAKISVELEHSNIGHVFDLGRLDSNYYISMEYIEGADIFKIMKHAVDIGYKIPIDICAYVGQEICAGLDYAHNKKDSEGTPLNIVHRDMSPQNVLISYSGEVKIVDFGIAKAALRVQQTEAGIIKGKYYYMSPEQAWGDPIDHRTDIFSTGIIVYEMLTGEMLYSQEKMDVLIDKVRKANNRPPSSLRPEIPKELDRIIMKALAKNSEDRYQNALDFGQALESFLYGFNPAYTSSRLAEMMAQLYPEDGDRQERIKTSLPQKQTGSTGILGRKEFFSQQSQHAGSLIHGYESWTASSSELPDLTLSGERNLDEDELTYRAEKKSTKVSRISNSQDKSALRSRQTSALGLSSDRDHYESQWEEETINETHRSSSTVTPSQDPDQNSLALNHHSKRRGAKEVTKKSAPVSPESTQQLRKHKESRFSPEPSTISMSTPVSSTTDSLTEESQIEIFDDEFQNRETMNEHIQIENVEDSEAEELGPTHVIRSKLKDTKNSPEKTFPTPPPFVTPNMATPVQTNLNHHISQQIEILKDKKRSILENSGCGNRTRTEESNFPIDEYHTNYRKGGNFIPRYKDVTAQKDKRDAYNDKKLEKLIIIISLSFVCIMAVLIPILIFRPWQSETTFLDIHSRPEGAYVFLDGRKLPGITPLRIHNIELDKAKEIELQLDGFHSWQETVLLKKSQTPPIFVVLHPIWGELSVTSSPSGAQIYINEKVKGLAPIRLQKAATNRDIEIKAVLNRSSHTKTLSWKGHKILMVHFEFEEIEEMP